MQKSIKTQIHGKILTLKTLGRGLGWSGTFPSILPRPPLVELPGDTFLKVCSLSMAEIQGKELGSISELHPRELVQVG